MTATKKKTESFGKNGVVPPKQIFLVSLVRVVTVDMFIADISDYDLVSAGKFT